MHFEVQVRASAAASTTHFSDDLTLLDTLTWTHQDTVVVSIERQAAIGVLDFNQVAVASGVPTCRDHYPRCCGQNRRSYRPSDVNATVHTAPAPAITRRKDTPCGPNVTREAIAASRQKLIRVEARQFGGDSCFEQRGKERLVVFGTEGGDSDFIRLRLLGLERRCRRQGGRQRSR